MLNGNFDLRTECEEIATEWGAVLGSAPPRTVPAPLLPFREQWVLARAASNRYELTLSDDAGRTYSFSAPPPEKLVAYLEYVACGRVLINGGDAGLPVHAALTAPSPKGIIAVVGAAMAGKSTTAAALWEAGWDLFCDDRCFIFDHAGDAPFGVPIPRRISLRTPALSYLEEQTAKAIAADAFTGMARSTVEPENSRLNFRPSSIRAEMENPSFQLKAVVILDPAIASGIEPVDIAKAIRPLLSCTAIHPHQTPVDTLTPWLSILNHVPLYRTGRAPVREMVGRFRDLAEQLELT